MQGDFKEKKTEAQWQKAIDDFWRRATPQWFDWLEWVLILGIMTFLAEQTKAILLIIVSAISYAALFFYLQSLVFSLEFHGFPLIRSERGRRIASLLLSGVLSIALWILLSSLVSQIKGKI